MKFKEPLQMFSSLYRSIKIIPDNGLFLLVRGVYVFLSSFVNYRKFFWFAISPRDGSARWSE